MLAISGPLTPISDTSSCMFGVNLNGTGLLASNSPKN